MKKAAEHDSTSEESIGVDAYVQLKHALLHRNEWLARVSESEAPGAISTFVKSVCASVPFYRESSAGTALSSVLPVGRCEHEAHPDAFLFCERRQWDVRLAAFTNGTLTNRIRVLFDGPGWYDMNYGSYAAVADHVPNLLTRMKPAKLGVAFVTNARYQPKTTVSVFVPELNCSFLRQLVLGRSEGEERAAVQFLRGTSVPLLYGKPSTLVELAKLDCSIGGVAHIAPFAILVSGESLYGDQRILLERHFRCRVVDAYIATEAGLIALGCSRSPALHVRHGAVCVEVLNSEGRVEDVGCGELVVTNLMNRAQAFVRYRLGDWGQLERGTCACGFVGQSIVTLRARETEHFSIGEQTVEATKFGLFLSGLQLRAFEVRQADGGRVVVRWTPSEGCNSSFLKTASLINSWLDELGWATSVISVPVREIVPRGGKQRRFV